MNNILTNIIHIYNIENELDKFNNKKGEDVKTEQMKDYQTF